MILDHPRGARCSQVLRKADVNHLEHLRFLFALLLLLVVDVALHIHDHAVAGELVQVECAGRIPFLVAQRRLRQVDLLVV